MLDFQVINASQNILQHTFIPLPAITFQSSFLAQNPPPYILVYIYEAHINKLLVLIVFDLSCHNHYSPISFRPTYHRL